MHIAIRGVCNVVAPCCSCAECVCVCVCAVLQVCVCVCDVVEERGLMLEAVVELIRGVPGELRLPQPPAPSAPLRAAAPPGRALSRSPSSAHITLKACAQRSGNMLSYAG